MFFRQPKITINGFSDTDIIEIKAKDLASAAFILGQKTKKNVAATLARRSTRGSKKLIVEAMRELEIIAEIAKSGDLTISNINYAQRYLDALTSFTAGTEISLPEAAFLQKEIETGCQTFITKNASGEIAFLHTEENGDDEHMTRPGKYSYK